LFIANHQEETEQAELVFLKKYISAVKRLVIEGICFFLSMLGFFVLDSKS